MEALQCATSNAASFLRRNMPGGFGAIEPGFVADLVILDADPLDNIGNTELVNSVVVRGRLLDRAELDRRLQQARSSVSHD